MRLPSNCLQSGTSRVAQGSGRSVDADSLPRVEGSVAVGVAGLYREHRVRLTRLARAITLDANLAEEVVHDAFVGLHRKWSTIENAGGYLQRSVVNLSIKAQRRRTVASAYQWPRAPITDIPEIDETWTARRNGTDGAPDDDPRLNAVRSSTCAVANRAALGRSGRTLVDCLHGMWAMHHRCRPPPGRSRAAGRRRRYPWGLTRSATLASVGAPSWTTSPSRRAIRRLTLST